jgi:hypothetical protein
LNVAAKCATVIGRSERRHARQTKNGRSITMRKTTRALTLATLTLAAALATAGHADSPADTWNGSGDQQTAKLADDDRAAWDDMFSRDVYPGMGVLSAHRATNKTPQRPIAHDRSAWEGMFSRDPYPGMGVGSAHHAAR